MTPERWAEIEDLFHRAAECDGTLRATLLDEACNRDVELRREVEALLSSEASARDNVQAAVHSALHDFGFSLAGEVVSHYRILDGIGGGGMGLVYRAEDIKLGRRVALKFLPEESAKDPAALARFEREARAASSLEHPNICPIYEFGEHQGQPFLVMQLLDGQTLGDLISAAALGKPPLDLDKLVDLAIQIAEGLEAAHRQGIIHRDIKPANIFVTNPGQAKILDFGLAKLARAVMAASNNSEPDTGNDADRSLPKIIPTADSDLFLSRTGVAMGTEGYMSPEQARSEKLDARTDLFSFGSVLYEMATGKRAFNGSTGPMLREAILNQEPSQARQLNPDLPGKLETIITRALEKDREARYQTASEMRKDLERFKREMEASRAPRWWAVASGAVVVLLVAGTVLWVAKRPRSLQTPLDSKLHQLTVNSSENPVTGGAISPDGKYLAYTDARGMHIKQVGSDESQPEEFKSGDVSWDTPAWFPDSKQLFVNAHPANESQSAWSSRTSSIWMFSVLDRTPRKIRDRALAWSASPDGLSISFGKNEGKLGPRELWLMGLNGEQDRKLYAAENESAICCLSFLPGGQRVTYITTNESGDTLVARDLSGGAVVTLLRPSETKKMGDFSWLADGRLIYSDPCNSDVGAFDMSCNYWSERFNTLTGKIMEKPKRLTNWAGFSVGDTSSTSDSKHVAFLQSISRGVSYVGDLEAGGTRLANPKRVILEEGGEDLVSDWTADSKTFILVSSRNDRYSLRKQSLNSKVQQSIVTSAAGLIEEAIVSPDDKWVILAVWLPVPGSLAQQPLMRVPITGGTPELILQRSLTNFGTAVCTRPPSNLCAFAERTEDHKQTVITAFDPVKGRGLELARFDIDPDLNLWTDNLLWSISPGGTRLAFARGPEGPIQIRSLLGGLTQVIQAKGVKRMRLLQWTADGKGLFVSNLTKDGSEVLHLDLRGNAKVLWKCNSDKCFGSPSPDGRQLAIYERKVTANMWMMDPF